MHWHQVSFHQPTEHGVMADKRYRSLAYVELHLALAMLFRRFTFELHETDISDVEISHDFMVPQPKLDTKGVRVKVTSTTASMRGLEG